MSGVLLGLDIGERYIGLALSDPTATLASPLAVIKRRGDPETIEELSGTIKSYRVSKIIAGLPSSHAEAIIRFAEKLAKRVSLPIDFTDESLTTSKARELMLLTRKKKRRRKMRDDALAAAFILEDYLNYAEASSELP